MSLIFKFFDFLDRIEQRKAVKEEIEKFVQLQQRKATILRLKREIEKAK
jgi:hypothetical protein